MQGIRINLIRIGGANFFKNSDSHPDSSSDSKISLQNLNFLLFFNTPKFFKTSIKTYLNLVTVAY